METIADESRSSLAERSIEETCQQLRESIAWERRRYKQAMVSGSCCLAGIVTLLALPAIPRDQQQAAFVAGFISFVGLSGITQVLGASWERLMAMNEKTKTLLEEILHQQPPLLQRHYAETAGLDWRAFSQEPTAKSQ